MNTLRTIRIATIAMAPILFAVLGGCATTRRANRAVGRR